MINGETYAPVISQQSPTRYRITLDAYSFTVENIDGKLFLEGNEVDIDIKPYLGNILGDTSLQQQKKAVVRAPIPGKILQLLVSLKSVVQAVTQMNLR